MRAASKGGATTVDVVNWQSWQGSRSPGIDHCEHVLFELPCKESADEDLQGISRAVAQCQTWLGVSPGTLGNGRKQTGRAFPKRHCSWVLRPIEGCAQSLARSRTARRSQRDREAKSHHRRWSLNRAVWRVRTCSRSPLYWHCSQACGLRRKLMMEAREANGLSHL